MTDASPWNHIPPQRPWSSRSIGHAAIIPASASGREGGYLPVANSAEKVEELSRTRWTIEDLGLRPEIRVQKDGTVVLSSRDIKEFIWHLYHLPGENGNIHSD
jgi:hypothetical protein